MVKQGYFVLAGVSAFVVLVFFFLPGGVVSGQTPTLTPVRTATITAPAPYQVATFANVNNSLECPAGSPAGWMTVTPGAAWEFLCGQCFFTPAATSTANVSPTAPWTGTGTPPVGCTPAAGGTPVATGTPGNSCYSVPTATGTPTATPTANNTCGGVISVVSVTLPTLSGVTTLISNSLVCEIINDTSVWCHGSIVYRDNHGTSDMGWQAVQVAVSPLPNTKTVYIKNRNWSAGGVNLSMYPGSYSGSATIGGGTGAGTCDGVGDVGGQNRDNTCGSGSSGITTLLLAVVSVGASGNVSTNNIDSTFSLAQDISCLSTPQVTITPTGTAVPGGYCGSVESVDSDLANSEVFSYSGFQVGSTSCFDLGGPGFASNNYDFGTLLNGFYQFFASDPNSWLAHICMQGLNIGVVRIMGMEVSLHMFAMVAGLGLLIRNMFIS